MQMLSFFAAVAGIGVKSNGIIAKAICLMIPPVWGLLINCRWLAYVAPIEMESS